MTRKPQPLLAMPLVEHLAFNTAQARLNLASTQGTLEQVREQRGRLFARRPRRAKAA